MGRTVVGIGAVVIAWAIGANAGAQDAASVELVRQVLPRGGWRVDAALAALESTLGGTSLGEPWTSPLGTGNGGVNRIAETEQAVLAEGTIGVARRADLSVRVCAFGCGRPPTTFGLGVRLRLLDSGTQSVALRMHASTYGTLLTTGHTSASWLVARRRMVYGLAPEFVFRFEGFRRDDQRPPQYGAMIPFTFGYADARFHAGGHVGAGFVVSRGAFRGVFPFGIDFAADVLERDVVVQLWTSLGAALVADDAFTLFALDPRLAVGIRIGSNPDRPRASDPPALVSSNDG